jgi:hypothetical protein
VTLLLENFGPDRRVVVRPHIGHTSPGAVLVDLDQVTDLRQFTGRALVLAGAAPFVLLDELHVEGSHRLKLTTGAGRS